MCKSIHVPACDEVDPTLASATPKDLPKTPKPTSDHSCITTIHGKHYDVSSFVKSHPGGPTAILLAHEIDATALFESYHPWSKKAPAVLSKYEVTAADLHPLKPPPFESFDCVDDAFYRELSKRVGEYFTNKGIHHKASTSRLLHYFTAITLMYALWWPYANGSWLGLIGYTLACWTVAGIGHDAAHFEVTFHPLPNAILAFCIGTISNPLRWYFQHTVAHHAHTNNPEKDPDLHHFHPYYRVHPYFRKDEMLASSEWMYKIIYPFMITYTFSLNLWEPLRQLGHDTINFVTPVTMRGTWNSWALGWGAMFWFVFVNVVLPAYYIGIGSAWGQFSLFMCGTGVCFGVSSQINHLNDHSMSGAMTGKSWGAKQVETSVNFAANNPVAFWFFNGLNYQIEHHLFPGINHEHLPALAPIVQKTCKEFGVNYQSYKHWSQAAALYVEYIKNVGYMD